MIKCKNPCKQIHRNVTRSVSYSTYRMYKIYIMFHKLKILRSQYNTVTNVRKSMKY